MLAAHMSHSIEFNGCVRCGTLEREFAITLACPYQSPARIAPSTLSTERTLSMRRDSNSETWLFTDEFGSTWRLRPTGDQDMPLTITIEHKAMSDTPFFRDRLDVPGGLQGPASGAPEAALVKADESTGAKHRCSGCGLRWEELSGVELCGDCWRQAQPVLHADKCPHCYFPYGQTHPGWCTFGEPRDLDDERLK